MIKQVFKTMVAFLAVATMTIGPVRGQNANPDVILDFTTNDWGLPTTGNNHGPESYSNGTYSITLSATTSYKLNSGYLLLGKSGSYLELPEFESAVDSIVVVGNSAASEQVKQNIYVGATAVSTQTTGATDSNTYVINENYRAAGNIYTLMVESAQNTQITYIKVYYVSSGGGSGSEPPTPGQNASEENIFQFCYDCQRNPAYPKTTSSASLAGFENPLVGYNGSGFEVNNTSAGPWKLEYMGLWSTTNQYGIEDFRVSNYQSEYNCTDVPVFRLYQWNATANEYQHASYGVVCAYAKVTNAVEHTAFFEAADGWGCVLTNSSHSSSMNITFDEDLTTGLTTLIPAPAVPHTVRFAAGNDGWTVTDVDSARSATAPAVLENVMAGDSLVVTAPATLPGKVKSVKAVKYVVPPTPLDNTTTAWTAGTFAVPAGGLTYSTAITVSGDVTLVLTDGTTLTLNKGISLAEGATLTIQGNGTMVVNGTNNSTASTVAGTGTLVLTSGTLTARGGNGGSVDIFGYGSHGGNGGNAINGSVIVSGGTLTARGGNGGSVGEASSDCSGGNGGDAISGTLTINGGSTSVNNGSNGSIGEDCEDCTAGTGGKAVAGTVTDNR